MSREHKKMLNGYIYFQVLYNKILIKMNRNKSSMQRNPGDHMDNVGRELERWEGFLYRVVWGFSLLLLGLLGRNYSWNLTTL